MKKAIRIVALLLIVAMLAVPVSAADFTPSVEQKGAPTTTVEEGAGATTDGIVVVPYAEAEEAGAVIEEALVEAYESIAEASLAEAAPALAEVLTTLGSDMTVEDLIVRDLFYVDTKLEAGTKVVLKFDLKVEKDALVIAMLFVDGEWVPVDPALVTVNDDGTVSIEFDGKVGVIAFVVKQAE